MEQVRKTVAKNLKATVRLKMSYISLIPKEL